MFDGKRRVHRTPSLLLIEEGFKWLPSQPRKARVGNWKLELDTKSSSWILKKSCWEPREQIQKLIEMCWKLCQRRFGHFADNVLDTLPDIFGILCQQCCTSKRQFIHATWQLGNLAIWQSGNQAMKQFRNLAIWQSSNQATRQACNPAIREPGNDATKQPGN